MSAQARNDTNAVVERRHGQFGLTSWSPLLNAYRWRYDFGGVFTERAMALSACAKEVEAELAKRLRNASPLNEGEIFFAEEMCVAEYTPIQIALYLRNARLFGRELAALRKTLGRLSRLEEDLCRQLLGKMMPTTEIIAIITGMRQRASQKPRRSSIDKP